MKIICDFDHTVLNTYEMFKNFDFGAKDAQSGLIIAAKTSKSFIFKDVVDFAENFEKKDLILLSRGANEFQKEKIKNSGVEFFFGKIIIISKDKVDEISQIYAEHSKEKIFFIDDRAEEIDKVKKKFPQIITMKMERPMGKYVEIKSELTDYTIKDLLEAKEIIEHSV
ncbi:MAG: hypothetical protein WA063_03595 [Minisyncoccia bacterium]